MTTTQNYGIDPNKLSVARGKLIVALGRDVTWYEFADLANITPGTISNLRSGRTGGTVQTWRKIVDMLRSRGVAVIDTDLVSPRDQTFDQTDTLN